MHAANAIHCDAALRNFSWTKRWGFVLLIPLAARCPAPVQLLRMARGTKQPQGWSWRRGPMVSDGLFVLGSVPYFIMTSSEPYADLDEDCVERRFECPEFPDTSILSCGHVI